SSCTRAILISSLRAPQMASIKAPIAAKISAAPTFPTAACKSGHLLERNPTPLPTTIWGAPKDPNASTLHIHKTNPTLPQGTVNTNQPTAPAVLTGFQQTEQARQLLPTGLIKAGVPTKVGG